MIANARLKEDAAGNVVLQLKSGNQFVLHALHPCMRMLTIVYITPPRRKTKDECVS